METEPTMFEGKPEEQEQMLTKMMSVLEDVMREDSETDKTDNTSKDFLLYSREALLNTSTYSPNDKLWNNLLRFGFKYVQENGVDVAAADSKSIMLWPVFELAEKLEMDDRVSTIDQLTMTAACSHWMQNQKKAFSAINVYRSMGGSRDMTAETCLAIEVSIERWGHTQITMDITEECNAWGICKPGTGIKTGTISEFALNLSIITIVENTGIRTKGYIINSEPILLKHARMKGHYLKLLQSDLCTPGRWSPDQRIISEYITKQVVRLNWEYEQAVQEIKKNNNTRCLPNEGEQLLPETQRKITIATLLDRTQINIVSTTDGKRKRLQRIRSMMQKTLNVLSQQPNSEGHVAIKGYHFSKAKRGQIDGVVIDLYPPASLVDIWERRQKEKERRIKLGLTQENS